MRSYPVIRSSGLALVVLALAPSSGCDDPEQFESTEPTAEALDLADADVADIECSGDCDVRIVAEGEESDADEHGPEAKDGPGDGAGFFVCAVLYEHKGFGGSQLIVGKGKVSWIGGPWNDHVSSLKVRSGCVLNAYEHKGFGGAHKAFKGHVPWVGDWWNDRISSFVCSC